MTGVLVALVIMVVWMSHLIFCLTLVKVNFQSPVFYLQILFQTYLFTGLFITAHDSMHGNVSSNKKLNNLIGWTTSFLFAGLSYKKLLKNHQLHHKYPGRVEDPDFSFRYQNIFLWWMIFISRYVTIIQLLVMAAAFNVFLLFSGESSIISFWVVPAFLSTFQLFYFGTFIPHMRPHIDEMKPHNARTQKKNHIWAMISCYFFGYHNEHHQSPGTPWWQMYKLKG